MNRSEELERLKRRIFSKSSDRNETYALINVMRAVGGYNVLMNMPIPAIKAVQDFLEWEARQVKKRTKPKK